MQRWLGTFNQKELRNSRQQNFHQVFFNIRLFLWQEFHSMDFFFILVPGPDVTDKKNPKNIKIHLCWNVHSRHNVPSKSKAYI